MLSSASFIHRMWRLGALIVRPLSRIVVGVGQYTKRRAAFSQLCAMDNRILDDIGVSRFQLRVMTPVSVEREVNGADRSGPPAIRQGYDIPLGKQSDNYNEQRLAA